MLRRRRLVLSIWSAALAGAWWVGGAGSGIEHPYWERVGVRAREGDSLSGDKLKELHFG